MNSLRQHAGLSDYNFTVDPTPARNVTTVKADHIRQLRLALEGALTALHLPTGGYAHPTLQENTSWIYAIDFQELRDQIASAWNSGSGGTSVDIRWLVSDQLGTPRMIFDQSGSLATVSRHDYLPFGEEVPAALRNGVPGYGANDGARQKFTLKERDSETGLDYFLARYYSSTQGRFTSPDEFSGGPDELYSFAEAASDNPTFYANLKNPQSLNMYQYTYNNPLRYTDADGHDPDADDPDPQDPACGCKTNPAQQAEAAKENLQKGIDALADAIGITAAADALRAAASDSATRIKTEVVVTAVVVKTLADMITGTRPAPIQPQSTTQPTTIAQPLAPPVPITRPHQKPRPSTEDKHEKGRSRAKRDYGREKGDAGRRLPRRPPRGPDGKKPKGPWPPKPKKIED